MSLYSKKSWEHQASNYLNTHINSNEKKSDKLDFIYYWLKTKTDFTSVAAVKIHCMVSFILKEK